MHHTLVHEGGYQVEIQGKGVRFTRPDGRVVPGVAPWPAARPAARLSDEEIARHRLTLVSRWDGERIDYGEVVASLSSGSP